MQMNKKEFEDLNQKERILREAAKVLSVEDGDLPRVVDRFLKEIEEMKSKNLDSEK